MKSMRTAVLIGLLASVCHAGSGSVKGEASARPALKTKNLLLVTTDGLRWQEVFGGADRSLMTKKTGGVANVPSLERHFARETPAARREALMPFIWGEIAKRGQIFGNPELKSDAKVTNGLNFSYPGYNEIFTGKADPRINSNDKIPNPNITVFEWLESKPEFQGRVAAFGSWDVYDSILNSERSKFVVNSGFDPLEVPEMNDNVKLLNQLTRETPRMWSGERYDSLTYRMGMEYLKQKKPRLFYMGLGDTDEFAHEGRYDHYLDAAHRTDEYVKELWDTVQAMPEYRGTTTMIVSTDHGRGEASDGSWKSHGAKTKGSERIWIAVIGPDTPPLGERQDQPLVTQSQIAATLSALLGQDYNAFMPTAAPPIKALIGRD